MNYPPSPIRWQLSVYLAQGREAEANKLLDALNQVQVAFGFPAYDMPEPADRFYEGLVTCPAEGRVARDLKSEIQL